MVRMRGSHGGSQGSVQFPRVPRFLLSVFPSLPLFSHYLAMFSPLDLLAQKLASTRGTTIKFPDRDDRDFLFLVVDRPDLQPSPPKALAWDLLVRGEIASSLQWTADLTVRSLDPINLMLSDSATSFATAAPSPALAHSMPSRISRIWILLYIEGFPRTLGSTSFSGSGILTKSTFCPFNYASALSVRSFAYRVFAGVD